jgi:hypothetical protein
MRRARFLGVWDVAPLHVNVQRKCGAKGGLPVLSTNAVLKTGTYNAYQDFDQNRLTLDKATRNVAKALYNKDCFKVY